jgi:hypothetical protein
MHGLRRVFWGIFSVIWRDLEPAVFPLGALVGCGLDPPPRLMLFVSAANSGESGCELEPSLAITTLLYYEVLDLQLLHLQLLSLALT